ncbi:MAG: DMT family transporter [Pseudomonadota bacterium]
MNNRRESRAIFFILIAVFAYSALPVLGAFSLETLDPTVFVAKSFFQYSLLQAAAWLVFRFFFDKEVRVPPVELPQSGKTYGLLALAGILIASSYTCLFTSFHFINKAGASVLYETWPIFVTIGLPLFFKQRFERLDTADVVYILSAFIGVVMIINGSGGTEPTDQPSLDGEAGEITGLVLATSSGITMAAAVIIKTHLMKTLTLNRAAIPVVAFVESSHRLAGAVALLLFGIATTDVSLDNLLRIDVSTAFALLELLGASAFWYAIIATRRSTINVLWYLTPVLAVIWLSLLGLAQINLAIVAGAALIIAANIMASRRQLTDAMG